VFTFKTRDVQTFGRATLAISIPVVFMFKWALVYITAQVVRVDVVEFVVRAGVSRYTNTIAISIVFGIKRAYVLRKTSAVAVYIVLLVLGATVNITTNTITIAVVELVLRAGVIPSFAIHRACLCALNGCAGTIAVDIVLRIIRA
jgi:hypothetical protein